MTPYEEQEARRAALKAALEGVPEPETYPRVECFVWFCDEDDLSCGTYHWQGKCPYCESPHTEYYDPWWLESDHRETAPLPTEPPDDATIECGDCGRHWIPIPEGDDE